LPAICVAMAMNLFGHGIALSSDFVIQGAPKLTSDAAGIPISEVISASILLVFTMGVTTTVLAYVFLNRDLKNGKLKVEDKEREKIVQKNEKNIYIISPKSKKVFAILIPIMFLIDIIIMIMANLQGG